jgi:hypothetical protein
MMAPMRISWLLGAFSLEYGAWQEDEKVLIPARVDVLWLAIEGILFLMSLISYSL